jgi:hypothetical protein
VVQGEAGKTVSTNAGHAAWSRREAFGAPENTRRFAVRSEASWHRILDRLTFKIACRRVNDPSGFESEQNGSGAKVFCAALGQFCAVEFLTGLGNRRRNSCNALSKRRFFLERIENEAARDAAARAGRLAVPI